MTEVAKLDAADQMEYHRDAWIVAHVQLNQFRSGIRRASKRLTLIAAILAAILLGLIVADYQQNQEETIVGWLLAFMILMTALVAYASAGLMKTFDVLSPFRTSERTYRAFHYTPAINGFMAIRAPEFGRRWEKCVNPRGDDDETIMWIAPDCWGVWVEYNPTADFFRVYGVLENESEFVETDSSAKAWAHINPS